MKSLPMSIPMSIIPMLILMSMSTHLIELQTRMPMPMPTRLHIPIQFLHRSMKKIQMLAYRHPLALGLPPMAMVVVVAPTVVMSIHQTPIQHSSNRLPINLRVRVRVRVHPKTPTLKRQNGPEIKTKIKTTTTTNRPPPTNQSPK